MFPMIATLEDLREARAVAERVREDVGAPPVAIGMMVKIPLANYVQWGSISATWRSGRPKWGCKDFLRAERTDLWSGDRLNPSLPAE